MLQASSLQSLDAALLEARAVFGDDQVELVRWPDDEDRRRVLAAAGAPRLLVLADDTPPPSTADLHEDWVRVPLDHHELLARRAALLRRVSCASHGPVLDEDGLLWWGERWVAIPPAQMPVVLLLVDRVRQLVRRAELLEAYAGAGGSDNPVAFKATMGRLVKRLARVDLALRSVRGRGYLLDVPNPCPLHARPRDSAPS